MNKYYYAIWCLGDSAVLIRFGLGTCAWQTRVSGGIGLLIGSTGPCTQYEAAEKT